MFENNSIFLAVSAGAAYVVHTFCRLTPQWLALGMLLFPASPRASDGLGLNCAFSFTSGTLSILEASAKLPENQTAKAILNILDTYRVIPGNKELLNGFKKLESKLEQKCAFTEDEKNQILSSVVRNLHQVWLLGSACASKHERSYSAEELIFFSAKQALYDRGRTCYIGQSKSDLEVDQLRNLDTLNQAAKLDISIKMNVSSGRVLLVTPDVPGACQKLLSEVVSIKKWNPRSRHKTLDGTKSCQIVSHEITLDISNFIPGDILDLILKEDRIQSGPNCFNAALYAARLTPSIRFTGQEELDFVLQSPLCTKNKKFADGDIGDIVILRDKDGVAVHGYVQISHDLVFEKAGAFSGYEYRLRYSDPKRSFLRFQIPDKYKWKCDLLTSEATDTCPFYLESYSCKTIQVLKNQGSWSSEAFSEVEEISCRLGHALTNPGDTELRKSSLGAFIQDLDRIRAKLNEAFPKTQTETDQMILRYLQTQINELKTSYESTIQEQPWVNYKDKGVDY